MPHPSPNTLNYFSGTGNLYWTKSGDAQRHLGNCPSFETEPVFQTKTHKTAMDPGRSEDREDLVQTGLTIRISLDEITPENLGLFFFGDPSLNTAGKWEFNILGLKKITGALLFTGNNAIGNQFEVTILSVSLVPQGSFNWVDDGTGYAQVVLTGKALVQPDGTFGTVEEIGSEST